MKNQPLSLAIALALASACGSSVNSSEISTESHSSRTQELVGRSCASNDNCEYMYNCSCDETNHCAVDCGGFGPCNFDYPCTKTPPRAPLPDVYENDDSLTSAFTYGHVYRGTAQPGHTIHKRGDQDFIPVYFSTAGIYTFETYNIVGEGVNTYLEVYKVRYVDDSHSTLELLVGANDNVCVWDVIRHIGTEQCLASKVLISAPKDSVYVAKITNKDYSSTTYNDFNRTRPGYDFRIY